MARRNPSTTAFRAGLAMAVVAACACTVFNGKGLPDAMDGGPSDGAPPGSSACDPAHVADDGQNCGACGHACGGGACRGGVCQPLVLVPAGDAGGAPIDIAVDTVAVYWASDDGSIHGLAKSSGAAITLASFAEAAGDARIAVDDNAIYYANATTATVYRVSKDGQTRTAIYTEAQGLAPGAIASNGTFVFWTHVAGTTVGGIMRASPDGGATEIWPNRQVFAEIAADDQHVYWAENYTSIMSGAVNGTGSAETLNTCTNVNVIALGATSVFWTSDGGVMSTPKGEAIPDGHCQTPTAVSVAAGGPGSFGIALAAGLVVWTDTKAGTVQVAPSGGCAAPPCPRTLASGQVSPGRVAADEHAAYWINDDHSIAKVAF